jgi:threonine/homoserine/homoserine lactone efflux protein
VTYLLLGLSLGLGAGLSPGPLLALVVTTSLSRGFAAGVRVACSPLVTDSVIITLSLLVVHGLPSRLTGLLGVGGGLFVIWLGIEALRELPAEVEAGPTEGRDPIRRGALVNVLSPHPWLFWLTVGGPVLLAAWAVGPLSALAFLLAFFALLVGAKVVVAGVVSSGRHRLSHEALRRANLVAGALLLLAGVVLVVEFTRALVTG